MWEAAGRTLLGNSRHRRVNLGRGGSHHSPTDCCITRTQGQDPGSAAPTWQSKELTCGTKHPLCAVPGCTTASVPEMKGHCCL